MSTFVGTSPFLVTGLRGKGLVWLGLTNIDF